MSKISLANKYRPIEFNDLTEQKYIKETLENQINNDSINNVYLFVGPAGIGKTTIARIFANKINNGESKPIEIDAASNNGVEQVRTIIDESKFKPLTGKYKVYILDECHMLSISAWNALLKLLEEPPKTTIFIMCTTDPQKIPETILSRVQRFNFSKISQESIIKRLEYILQQENITNYDIDAIKFIAKISEGGMRTAISNLDKLLGFTNNITMENTINILGISEYDDLYQLLINLIDDEVKSSIDIIESIYKQGKDLKLFIKQFIQFILDVEKYLLYNSYDYIQIPNNIDLKLFKETEYDKIIEILDEIIDLNNQIKYEQNPKIFIESKILLLSRGK